MDIKSLHHVAYRCKDAKQTADFYTKVLGLEYAMAVSEDRVPSTGEAHPYMHIFFRMDDGSYVAFFELPESPEMGRDGNTPLWVQHLALRVPDEETLLRRKAHLESMGIEVLGPDVNESARDFTVVEEGIRFGLAGVKNVGRAPST